MNNPRALYKISENAKLVFLIAAFIFFISVIPVSYNAGYSNGIEGSAGLGSDDPSSNTASQINYIATTVAGVISSLALAVSALASVRKMKIEGAIEEMKLKSAQIQYDMQMKEIEKLRLELEMEKRVTKKKGIV